MKAGAAYTLKDHTIQGGVKRKISKMDNILNESTYEAKQPIPIANIYSKRFFNIGAAISF